MARDVGVDTKTVQSYFQILEDTLDCLDERHVKTVKHFSKEFKDAEALCVSRDPSSQVIGGVRCELYIKAFKELNFLG